MKTRAQKILERAGKPAPPFCREGMLARCSMCGTIIDVYELRLGWFAGEEPDLHSCGPLTASGVPKFRYGTWPE